jgi:hypothetical protein
MHGGHQFPMINGEMGVPAALLPLWSYCFLSSPVAVHRSHLMRRSIYDQIRATGTAGCRLNLQVTEPIGPSACVSVSRLLTGAHRAAGLQTCHLTR